MKKNRKIFLAFIMSLMMALVMAVPMSVSAAETETNAAKIGDIGYPTLQAAVDAAKNEETVVLLLKDVTENVTIPNGTNMILDLNGKILNGGTLNGSSPAITNYGTLVVKDSVGTGKVMREDNGKAGYYVVDNQGTMTIESGYFYNSTGLMPKGSSLIRNAGAGKAATLNIKGGTVHCDGFIAVKNDDLGILNVTGGTIKTTGDTANMTASAVQNWSKAEITGGTIGNLWTGAWDSKYPNSETIVSGSAVVEGRIVVRQEGNKAGDKLPTVNISGGTINAEWMIADKNAEVTASGGVFNTIDAKVNVTSPAVAEVTINGVTKTVLNVDAINEYIKDAPKGTAVKITKAPVGAKFVAPDGVVIENKTEGEINVNDKPLANGETVTVKPADPTNPTTPAEKPEKSPETGDNSNMGIMLAIMGLAGVAAIGTVALGRRKRSH